MKTDFKLIGLNRQRDRFMTCVPLHNEEIFWPKMAMSMEKFNELWNYFTGLSPMRMIAEIEHDGLTDDGVPINGTVVNVRDYDDVEAKTKSKIKF